MYARACADYSYCFITLLDVLVGWGPGNVTFLDMLSTGLYARLFIYIHVFC